MKRDPIVLIDSILPRHDQRIALRVDHFWLGFGAGAIVALFAVAIVSPIFS